MCAQACACGAMPRIAASKQPRVRALPQADHGFENQLTAADAGEQPLAQAAGQRQQQPLAIASPYTVATKAVAIPAPSVPGWSNADITCIRPEHGAQHPEGRRVARRGLEDPHGRVVLRFTRPALGRQHVAQHRDVDAVHGQRQAWRRNASSIRSTSPSSARTPWRCARIAQPTSDAVRWSNGGSSRKNERRAALAARATSRAEWLTSVAAAVPPSTINAAAPWASARRGAAADDMRGENHARGSAARPPGTGVSFHATSGEAVAAAWISSSSAGWSCPTCRNRRRTYARSSGLSTVKRRSGRRSAGGASTVTRR